MSEALRLPGVVDVVTAEDIPGQRVRQMSGYEEELLAATEVEQRHLLQDAAPLRRSPPGLIPVLVSWFLCRCPASVR